MRYMLVLLAAAWVMAGCNPSQPGQQAERPTAAEDNPKGSGGDTGEQGRQPDNPDAAAGPPGDNGPANGTPPPDSQGSDPEQKAGADDQPLLLDDEGPLLLDDGPPLLLGDGGGESVGSTGPVADNSRCHHCHLNYVQEEIATVHARANIGCADCHGKSDAHIADESWSWGGNGTPPETMYPREKVNKCCLGCHRADQLEKTEHEAFLAGTAKEKYCTDCHGNHRLTERQCKWR